MACVYWAFQPTECHRLHGFLGYNQSNN